MTKNAYILHGSPDHEEFHSQNYPSPSNSHWLPWLQKQLLIKGYQCQTPELPMPWDPDYQAWKAVLEFFPVDEQTALIGHSCGAGFALQWAKETGKQIEKLVLVAPYLDPHRQYERFMQIPLAPDMTSRIGEIHVLYSEDEPVPGVKESVDTIMEMYPDAALHTFTNKGHFCLGDMGTQEFPELLEIVL